MSCSNRAVTLAAYPGDQLPPQKQKARRSACFPIDGLVREKLSVGTDRHNFRNKSERRRSRQIQRRPFGWRSLLRHLLAGSQFFEPLLNSFPLRRNSFPTWARDISSHQAGGLVSAEGSELCNRKRRVLLLLRIPFQHDITTSRFRKVDRGAATAVIDYRTDRFQISHRAVIEMKGLWRVFRGGLTTRAGQRSQDKKIDAPRPRRVECGNPAQGRVFAEINDCRRHHIGWSESEARGRLTVDHVIRLFEILSRTDVERAPLCVQVGQAVTDQPEAIRLFLHIKLARTRHGEI